MAESGRIPVLLRLCHGCRQFVKPAETACIFCGGELDALEDAHEAAEAELARATEALRAALLERGVSLPGAGAPAAAP